MELIIFIIIIAVIISKNSKKKISKQAVPNQSKSRVKPNVQRAEKTAAQLKQEIWNRLSEESKAKMGNRDMTQRSVASGRQVSDAYASGSKTTESGPQLELTAAQQIQRRRAEEKNTSILERAKGNAAENNSDVTLQTLEAEHRHSERVAPAVHKHPEDVIPESMLGSVSDLMVKGYDGNLCFERDFVGEAMDMISRFTVPGEVPDYSMSERAE